MHRCLRITEILHLIIGFLVDEWGDETCCIPHEDIAGLARTCKAFMDPALDVLWRTQPSLSPLVMCLPEHFWTLERGVVSLLQEPSHEVWLTLKRYSRRIRVFDYISLDLPAVCQHILETVFSPALSHELFPSLRTLNVDVFDIIPPTSSIQFLAPIRLPRLLRLTLTTSGYPPWGYLYFVPACAPSLEALSIDTDPDDFPEGSTPAPLEVDFEEIPYLRSLYLSCNLDVLSSSVCKLIQLQYLCDLTMTSRNDIDAEVALSIQPILPSLQCLDIFVVSLSQCSNVLSYITSSELGSVTTYYVEPALRSEIYTLFQEIECIHERFPDFHTLDVQIIQWHAYQQITDPSFDLPQSTLTPLLACHRLRVLILHSFGTLDIDDTFVMQITLAWPDIEFLHLYGFQEKKGRVTLKGLCELLRGCPRLSSLSMQIDARILPEQEPETQSLSLETLDVAGSRIEDKKAVEKYLRILAPKLESLTLESWQFPIS